MLHYLNPDKLLEPDKCLINSGKANSNSVNSTKFVFPARLYCGVWDLIEAIFSRLPCAPEIHPLYRQLLDTLIHDHNVTFVQGRI
jgi:hypothetical protein